VRNLIVPRVVGGLRQCLWRRFFQVSRRVRCGMISMAREKRLRAFVPSSRVAGIVEAIPD